MRKLSAEAKQAIIYKVLARDGRTVGERAKLLRVIGRQSQLKMQSGH